MTLPDWLLNRPVAHRGLHRPGGACPENSLAALAAAARRGYAAEIDVQLSADGIVMVFHDRALRRLTGVPGVLGTRRAAALERLHLLGGRERPPTLAEVLRRFPDLPLLIELKLGNPALAPAVAALLDRHRGPFAVQSFDPALTGWFADHRPDWPRGLIGFRRRVFGHRVAEPRFELRFLEIARPHFIAWSVRELPVPAAVPKDLPVITWTVRLPRDRTAARRYARNMIFEGLATRII